jgi:membrane protein YqaA with SNARE-associated domain
MLWLVAIWSAAEAALWFVVADVPISVIAVRLGPRQAMKAALVAALASSVGAAILWWWFRDAPLIPMAIIGALPGIHESTAIEAARLYGQGHAGVLRGSFSGIPFKLFVVDAAQQRDWTILLLAPLLRFPRFLMVGLGVGGLSRLLMPVMSERARLGLLAACWSLFYAWYWLR